MLIMIWFLQGKIIELNLTQATILTNSWVWYSVLINEIVYAHVALHENVELYIYHHKTENSENLFGFMDTMDKSVFTELIKISGIWGKVAMLILSLWIDKLITAVQMWDNKTIEAIKGIGKKMAEKIILELKDKDFIKHANISTKPEEKQTIHLPTNVAVDIKNTLVNMWYQSQDVDLVLAKVPEDLSEIWEILPYCIRQLS